MESRLLAAITRGHGVVTTRELVSAGVDAGRIRRWVRTGRLVTVRRGVYTTAELWAEWDDFRGRPLARIRALDRTLEVPQVHSHDSAAIVQRLPLIHPRDAGLHVTRRHLRGSTTSAGVRHHGARYGDHRLRSAEDLTVLDIARTVVDLTREHGYLAGLVAADGAMQKGISRRELRSAAAEVRGWPHSVTVAAVVDDADPGAESVLESLVRDLVVECAIGPVETQFPRQVSGGIAWIDMRVGRLLIEADGVIKFIAREEGGVVRGDPRRALWDERRRQQEACADVFAILRLGWEDMWGAARDRARQRIRTEAAAAARRYGSELPADVAAFAARHRGERYRVAD